MIKAHVCVTERLQTIIDCYFPDISETGTESDVIIKDREECWDRMCTRLCQQSLSWENALLLLPTTCLLRDNKTGSDKNKTGSDKNKNDKNKSGTDKDLRWTLSERITIEIIKAFKRCTDSTFESILPCIINHLVYEKSFNETLFNYLVSRCNQSIRVTTSVYWALMVAGEKNKKVCDFLLSKLLRAIPKDLYGEIMKINEFVRTIEDNYNPSSEIPISNLGSIGECVSPTHPERGSQKVSDKIMQGEISANRPVPILLSPETNKENTILYKNEDLRTDLIIMSVLRLMKDIVEEQLGLDLYVITYNIQPTSSKSGYIGVVDKCNTIYKIEEKFNLTLNNYIKKYNPDTPSKELSQRFIRSSAFYSVMTFLLGIGDRHLDNIMVTERGELFHIDYGFVLGKDPKPMKTPYMRISEGMLDAIGGAQSEEYIQFKDLYYKIYEVSRRHVNTFVCLLSLLPKQNSGDSWTNPAISQDRVLREVVKRFSPGETYEKAKNILDTKIDKSTNMTNQSRYFVVDFFHKHRKEGTISNMISYTVGTTISGTSNLLSGIWDYMSGASRIRS